MRSLDDMDMMEIGNGALTIKYVLWCKFLHCFDHDPHSEQRTHFAMWAALKSPILLGTDVSLNPYPARSLDSQDNSIALRTQ
jgi:alpha-galactosidase